MENLITFTKIYFTFHHEIAYFNSIHPHTVYIQYKENENYCYATKNDSRDSRANLCVYVRFVCMYV